MSWKKSLVGIALSSMLALSGCGDDSSYEMRKPVKPRKEEIGVKGKRPPYQALPLIEDGKLSILYREYEQDEYEDFKVREIKLPAPNYDIKKIPDKISRFPPSVSPNNPYTLKLRTETWKGSVMHIYLYEYKFDENGNFVFFEDPSLYFQGSGTIDSRPLDENRPEDE